MKCLVTGGLGFVGSNLVDILREKGHEVYVWDNLVSDSSSKSYMRDDVEYDFSDVRDIANEENLHRHPKYDVIFHLAALARIQPSFKEPLSYLSNDIMGTSAVCDLARHIGCKVVYAGSSSAYAGPMLNPYAFAKYIGEQVCQMYSEIYGTSTVTARFFNVYGDRQPRKGEFATVVGIFEDQAKNRTSLTVTGNGNQRRDFTHVFDIASGLILLSEGEYKGEVFNLGSAKNLSIIDLAKAFSDDVVFIPERPGEAQSTLADISETTRACGWIPKYDIEKYVEDWKIKNL